MPRCARSRASVSPTGPAPTIKTCVSLRVTTTCPPLLLRPDLCKSHDLGPLVVLFREKLAELLHRPRHHGAPELAETRAESTVDETGVDLLIEPRDDFGRRAFRGAYPLKGDGLVTRHKFAHGRDVRQGGRP